MARAAASTVFLCAVAPSLFASSPALLAGARVRAAAPPSDLPPEIAALQVASEVLPPLPEGGRLVPLADRPVGGGVTEVDLRQEIGGYTVFRGGHSVFFGPHGRVLAVLRGETAESPLSGGFTLTAAEAAAAASARLSGSGGRFHVVSEDGEWTTLRGGGSSGPVLARREVLARGSVPVWRVEIGERDDPASRWCVLVHGSTGEVLETIEATRHAARGRVYPHGSAAGAEMVPFVDGETVLDPASPAGWIYADATEGNNLTVWEDRAGDGGGTLGAVATGTGEPLTFDFPFTGNPLDDLDLALTNVFWALNAAHDRFHALGFDEAAGNFQTENFGRGGLQGDYTRVYVQYAAGLDATGVRNSNTSYAPSDGNYNSMTFGLWDLSGEVRDGALDTGLVFHEYTHMVVMRMVGNDVTCDDGIQPRALAEGWADYFAADFTGDRVIGAWVSGDPDVGLRTQAVGDNRYTYANLCYINGDYCNNEQNGEIWSAILWDLREALQATYGPEEGRERAARLIVEGMRYAPCQPTYVQARDGILLADTALTGGADRCLVRQVMRLRGIGASASSTGPDDSLPGFAFDPAPECTGGSGLAWTRERYGDDADARLVLAAGDGSDRTVAVVASSGDAESFPVPGPGATRVLAVPLRPGAPAAGDGVLQVTGGDTVTARCPDCPGTPEAQVAVSTDLAVFVNGYSFSSESCHDDNSEPSITDFRNELPSILDAGERSNLTVTLGNGESFPLEDVRVSVSSDNPAVHVIPAGPLPIGEVQARNRYPRPFSIVYRAVADPSVAFGDTATLTFLVEARGMRGTTRLTFPLAADYREDRGLSAWGTVEDFESTSPSAALWTHAPAAGRPADQWGIQDCGDGGGRAMVYAGPNCTDYDDTPSAATLVSPPLFDLSGGVQAIHPVSFSWRNDVDLGVDSTLYCDSEMVLLYLTDDPDRPRYDIPRTLRYDGLQYWVQWPRFLDAKNTSGWETAYPRNPLTNNSLNGMDLAAVRLWWIFFTDVYGPGDGCRASQTVAGGYKLDNVSFTYDAVGLAPAAVSCNDSCAVAAVLTLSPAQGPRCPGDAVSLSGELSEATGCPGDQMEYRFTGPGLDTGYTDNPTAEAIAARGARWTLAARCKADTSCSQSTGINDPTRDDSTAGRVAPGSLRVRREGTDVLLAWDGTRAPEAYAVFRVTPRRGDPTARRNVLAAMAQSPPPEGHRIGSPDARTFRDPGAAADGSRLHVYRVFSRMPCSGEALDR